MPRRNPTSVTFNETIQKIKDELAPVYSLKNILSAGLLLFSRLSDGEQKKIVAELNQMVDIDISAIQSRYFSNAQSIRNVLREITLIEKQSPGTIVKILGEEDSALVDDFRKALGPEPQKQKRKRG